MSRADLDPRAILQTLGLRRPAGVRPVAGGFDARIWRVAYGNRSFALRVLRPEQHAVAAREIAASHTAQRAGLPVPRLHTHGSWHGHPVLLFGWCAGRTLAEVAQAQPWRVPALAMQFGRTQALIHRLPAPAALEQDWIAWAGDDAALAERLREVQRTPPVLLHGDYHPLNVLVDDTGISGVLDWANARAGDGRADAARTWTILRIEPLGPHAAPALELGRRVLAWYWRRGYEQVAGRLEHNALLRAWAGAVMQRDLAHRVGQPDSWWRPQHLEQLARWTQQQRRRAGLGMV